MPALIEITLRLLQPLPIEHTAKNGRLCVLYVRDLSAHGVHLMLRTRPGTDGLFVMGRTSRAVLDRELLHTGFSLPYEPQATLYRFFVALVRDGRAEVIAGPHCSLPSNVLQRRVNRP